jgi:hypothetical protein
MKEIEELKKKEEINNAVFRKSVIKVIQRLGLTFLKQRLASSFSCRSIFCFNESKIFPHKAFLAPEWS